MMKTNFDRIEAHLRALFEKNLPRIFTRHHPNLTLVEELMQVMQDNSLKDEFGKLYAPDLFLLKVSPEDMLEWQMHQDILDEMATSLHTMGLSVDLVFIKQPKIELVPDPDVSNGSFSIQAYFSQKDPDLPDTAAMVQSDNEEHEPGIPENAMLIIAGKTSFPLEKPVIDIGRHSSNDLVLQDLHVSRHHAQLRAIKNHYVIFDVGSTGGIFINGSQITQATLHAGDVIRIGTVNLIFNQEPTSTFATTVLPAEDDLDNLWDDEA